VKITVVGGGIFGCTAAIQLAQRGHDVTLYERHTELLAGGSGNSCGRIHRGYHYPRSEPTARATMAAAGEFTAAFSPAVYTRAIHRYRIADDSPVSRDDYRAFLKRLSLPWTAVGDDFAVPEALVYVPALRTILRRQLRAAGVTMRLGQCGGPDMPGYDLTVLATYGQHTQRPLQYEVVETALVELDGLKDQSWVVLDGPYCCIDPLPGTGLHLLYDVVHSIHHTNTGYGPEIPERLERLIDAGTVTTRQSNVEQMLHTARAYLPVREATYWGSRFTIRAVLPDVDGTDERPTLVEHDGANVWILAGKIDTCLVAARQVTEYAREKVPC